MTRAAQRGEVYHLWWHPHNFGNYPHQSMEGLTRILNHYDHLKARHAMQSCTMSELVQKMKPIAGSW